MNEIQERVWEGIVSLNRTWTGGGVMKDIEKFFHFDAIALVGTEKKKVCGRDACVAHWESCSEKIIVRSWKECGPSVCVYGDGVFAVVEYAFEFSFEKNGEVRDVFDRDLFSLVFEDGEWVIVAATV